MKKKKLPVVVPNLVISIPEESRQYVETMAGKIVELHAIVKHGEQRLTLMRRQLREFLEADYPDLRGHKFELTKDLKKIKVLS